MPTSASTATSNVVSCLLGKPFTGCSWDSGAGSTGPFKFSTLAMEED